MMKEIDDKNLSEELFGGIIRPPCTGGHVPTPEQQTMLALPSQKGGALIFCTGCGFVTVFTVQGSEETAREFGTEIPESWTGHYFQTDVCTLCEPEIGLRNVQLKEAKFQ